MFMGKIWKEKVGMLGKTKELKTYLIENKAFFLSHMNLFHNRSVGACPMVSLSILWALPPRYR